MKTVFRSRRYGTLWRKDEAVEKENRKCDTKALSLIQQAVDGSNMDRILEAKTAHVAWDILRKFGL